MRSYTLYQVKQYTTYQCILYTVAVYNLYYMLYMYINKGTELLIYHIYFWIFLKRRISMPLYSTVYKSATQSIVHGSYFNLICNYRATSFGSQPAITRVWPRGMSSRKSFKKLVNHDYGRNVKEHVLGIVELNFDTLDLSSRCRSLLFHHVTVCHSRHLRLWKSVMEKKNSVWSHAVWSHQNAERAQMLASECSGEHSQEDEAWYEKEVWSEMV